MIRSKFWWTNVITQKLNQINKRLLYVKENVVIYILSDKLTRGGVGVYIHFNALKMMSRYCVGLKVHVTGAPKLFKV
jgi:hypothetical protein